MVLNPLRCKVIDSWFPHFRSIVRFIMAKFLTLFALGNVLASGVQSVSITDIQGVSWSSPYTGQTVHNVTGTVVAKARTGLDRTILLD